MTSKKSDSQTEKSEEFQRFEDLAKALLQVPKAELDRRAKEHEREKKKGSA